MAKKKPIIAVIGSHSALDVCRGAKDEGFETLVIVQSGRDKTYTEYYKTKGKLGCVDQCLEVEKFADILKPSIQDKLRKLNVIFIPHRSFEVYLNFDYAAIENDFKIPMFGNRKLLKIEERGTTPNQYDLLDKAQIRYPKQFSNPKDIDRLCLVKVLEKTRGFERAFFLVSSYKDYIKKTRALLKKESFTAEQLARGVIEEFITGVQVNFNFFYSPLNKRLELIGTDTRRQTNLEGINKIPADYQSEVIKNIGIKYEEAGHIAVTVLESLLEEAFAMGQRFVSATQSFGLPIIGPFGLQAVITPGPPKKEIIVFDVSPRMPGSPGITATPYGSYLYGYTVSMGRRVAMEIKQAIKQNRLQEIISL